jgi:hypothetical protein
MDGFTMSGKELEALCEAAGYSFKGFAQQVGLRGGQIRSFRAAKLIDFSEDPISYAYLEQMRERIIRGELAATSDAKLTSAAPPAPRKPQTTYAGKPTLKLRTLDLLRANGSCRRADIIQALACHPVEANRVLRELCAGGLAEKVRHGVYRAVGRA